MQPVTGTVIAVILIFGATGTIGRATVHLLVERGIPVRAVSRDPAAVVPGAQLARGEFDDPGSLRAAAQGADAVLMLTAPSAAVPDHDRAMLDAATAAGIRVVVKISAIDADAGGRHSPGERAVRERAAQWTLLRPSSYASNALRWAEPIKAGQPVPNHTGAGTQGVVDPRDVAAVAVEALTGDHHGKVYTLTGPHAVSVPEQVAMIGAELRREIAVADVPAEQARRQLGQFLDPETVESALRGYEQIRAGGNATVTGDVAAVLGRQPRSFRVWVRDHRGAFTGA